MRNQNELDELLAELQDPASPNFKHYLSAQQFAAEFGPTEHDYQALIQFAHENGLVVTGTHSNRLLLDVSGETSAVEKALHVKMMVYDHPIRGRFYAPDREPSLDLEEKVLDISGLDNFALPQPMSLKKIPMEKTDPYVTGSGPGGYFIDEFFPADSPPGLPLASGDEVVWFERWRLLPRRGAKNAHPARLPPLTPQAVLHDVNGGTCRVTPNVKVDLNIVTATALAPALARVNDGKP